MKILIADQKKTFCLRIPLTLLCSRVGAALLAGGIRRARRLPEGPEARGEVGLITTDQAHALLKTLRQSRQTLRASGLPLLDIEEGDGGRFMIIL